MSNISSTGKICSEELSMLVYNHLKELDFHEMAEAYLVKKWEKNKRQHFRLDGSTRPLTFEEYRDLAARVDPKKLETIFDILHSDRKDFGQISEVNFSLLTHCDPLLRSYVNRTPLFIPEKRIKLREYLKRRVLEGDLYLENPYEVINCSKRVKRLKRVLAHTSAIFCLTTDRTSTILFTGGGDGLVKIWDIGTALLKATLRGHTDAIYDMSVNYDNTHIASCGSDKRVIVWCLKTTRPLYILKAHAGTITSVFYSPYPVGILSYLTSISIDGLICFWKIDLSGYYDPTPIKFFEKGNAKNYQIECYTYSPGGTYVIIGSSDPLIRLFKFTTKGPVRTMDIYGHVAAVECVVFDHFGSRFATGSADGTIRIWSLSVTSWHSMEIPVGRTPTENSTTQVSKTARFSVCIISWMIDSLIICSADSDNCITSYNSHTGELVAKMIGHTDKISVMYASPCDIEVLFSAGSDGRVFVWNVRTGAILQSFLNDLGGQGIGIIYDLLIMPNGFEMVYGDINGNFSIFGIGQEATYDKAPDVQFFHTDYWPAKLDEDSCRVIDINSDIDSYLMPPPIFVDYFGIPLKDSYQALIPGKSTYIDPFNRDTCGASFDIEQGLSFLPLDKIEGVKETFKTLYGAKCASWGHGSWITRLIVPDITSDHKERETKIRRQYYHNEQFIINNVRQTLDKTSEKEQRIGKLLRLRSLKKQQAEKPVKFPHVLVREEAISRSVLDDSLLADAPITDESSFTASGFESDDQSIEHARRRIARLRSLRPRDLKKNVQVNKVPPQPDNYPSKWLDSDVPSFNVYVPQINDYVYYIQEGHKLYVQELISQKLEHLLPVTENGYEDIEKVIFPEISEKGVELCKVVDMEYIYKGVTIVQLKLELQDSGSTTLLEYHKLENVVEFLILKERYDNSMRRKWNIGMPIRSVINNSWWYGKIEGIQPLLPSAPEMLFTAFKIKWETGEYDLLSPWDLFPIDSYLAPVFSYDQGESQETPRTSQRITPTEISPVVSRFRGFLASPGSASLDPSLVENNENVFSDSFVDLNRSLNGSNVNLQPLSSVENFKLYEKTCLSTLWADYEASVSRIIRGLKKLATYECADIFYNPVNLSTYDDYWFFVPLPMCYAKIEARLRNSFYRSKDALLYDVNLINYNAGKYNRPNSLIVRISLRLTSRVTDFIRDESLQYPFSDEDEITHGYGITRSRSPSTFPNGSSTLNWCDEVDTSSMDSWFSELLNILVYLTSLNDSKPFLDPVDQEEVPDYYTIVATPMDFTTIKCRLSNGFYSTPTEFFSDIKLIFENSRLYNTNTRSKIYSMTQRLSAVFERKANEFMDRWNDRIKSAPRRSLRNVLKRKKEVLSSAYNLRRPLRNVETVNSNSMPTFPTEDLCKSPDDTSVGDRSDEPFTSPSLQIEPVSDIETESEKSLDDESFDFEDSPPAAPKTKRSYNTRRGCTTKVGRRRRNMRMDETDSSSSSSLHVRKTRATRRRFHDVEEVPLYNTRNKMRRKQVKFEESSASSASSYQIRVRRKRRSS